MTAITRKPIIAPIRSAEALMRPRWIRKQKIEIKLEVSNG